MTYHFVLPEFNIAFIYVSDDMQWGLEKIATRKGGNKNVFFLGKTIKLKKIRFLCKNPLIHLLYFLHPYEYNMNLKHILKENL